MPLIILRLFLLLISNRKKTFSTLQHKKMYFYIYGAQVLIAGSLKQFENCMFQNKHTKEVYDLMTINIKNAEPKHAFSSNHQKVKQPWKWFRERNHATTQAWRCAKQLLKPSRVPIIEVFWSSIIAYDWYSVSQVKHVSYVSLYTTVDHFFCVCVVNNFFLLETI